MWKGLRKNTVFVTFLICGLKYCLGSVSPLLHLWLRGLHPAPWVVMSYQCKALGMGKADGGRAASQVYLPGDSSIPLGSLIRRVFF